jgi:hypothetical protein
MTDMQIDKQHNSAQTFWSMRRNTSCTEYGMTPVRLGSWLSSLTGPSIVCVLPDPVCPYASTHTL